MFNYKESCIKCQDDLSLFELFHKETSLKNDNLHYFQQSVSRAFDNDLFINNIKNKQHNQPYQKNDITLFDDNVTNDLFENIDERKSERNFINRPILFKTLSNILTKSFGKSSDGSYTVPSAGGIYSIDLILAINNVSGLHNGIYKYKPYNKSISPIFQGNNFDYAKMTANLNVADKCAFSIHFICKPDMPCYKYQDRGYRFLNIECGHISQNLCIVSNELGVSSLCSGGFLDGEFLNYLTEISRSNYSSYLSLYEMFFGYSK